MGEFGLHMVVFLILVPILYYSLRQIGREQSVLAYILVNGLIGAILYVTTSFSDRTPDIADGEPLFFGYSAGLSAHLYLT